MVCPLDHLSLHSRHLPLTILDNLRKDILWSLPSGLMTRFSEIIFRKVMILAKEVVAVPKGAALRRGLVAVLLDVVKTDLLPAMHRVNLVLL